MGIAKKSPKWQKLGRVAEILHHAASVSFFGRPWAPARTSPDIRGAFGRKMEAGALLGKRVEIA